MGPCFQAMAGRGHAYMGSYMGVVGTMAGQISAALPAMVGQAEHKNTPAKEWASSHVYPPTKPILLDPSPACIHNYPLLFMNTALPKTHLGVSGAGQGWMRFANRKQRRQGRQVMTVWLRTMNP